MLAFAVLDIVGDPERASTDLERRTVFVEIESFFSDGETLDPFARGIRLYR